MTRRTLFKTLILTIGFAGLSQGVLLPLLSLMMEGSGVPAGLNGVNAAALYFGILVATPFLEKPVRRYGYRKVILAGLLTVALTTALLFWRQGYFEWLVLRLTMGIGNSALHYTTQLWITSTSPGDRRGREISLYGFSYGAGFGLGPLALRLVPFGLWLPFALVLAFNLLAILLILRIPTEYPAEAAGEKTFTRYRRVVSTAWYGLWPALTYGFLEAALNNSLPIFAERSGLPVSSISLLLPAFVFGALALQLPLGAAGDRWGRKAVLMTGAGVGSLALLAVPAVTPDPVSSTVLFAVAGGFAGSMFSLGLAFLADILPPENLPTANVLASVNFGIGSILGPVLGGLAIEEVSPASLFYLLFLALASFSAAGSLFRAPEPERSPRGRRSEGTFP